MQKPSIKTVKPAALPKQQFKAAKKEHRDEVIIAELKMMAQQAKEGKIDKITFVKKAKAILKIK